MVECIISKNHLFVLVSYMVATVFFVVRKTQTKKIEKSLCLLLTHTKAKATVDPSTQNTDSKKGLCVDTNLNSFLINPLGETL